MTQDFNINDTSENELVDIRHLTNQMKVYTGSHVKVLIKWLHDHNFNLVRLGNPNNPLVLISPKEFDRAINQLAEEGVGDESK